MDALLVPDRFAALSYMKVEGTLFMREMTPVWKVLIEAVGSSESGSVDSEVSM